MIKKRKLTIVVPAYNEERTIAKILKKITAVKFRGWDEEIIVVDDGSSDKTADVLSQLAVRSLRFTVLRHRKNLGKGMAIMSALDKAKGEAIIIQDADLEYDPEEMTSLLDFYPKNNCRAVFGSRNLTSNRRSYWYYFWGVKLLSFLINLLYKTNISDPYTCYKLVDTKTLRKIGLKSKGFEIEAEITVKLLRAGIKIWEVPIQKYNPRSHEQGKKIRAIDGLTGLWVILKNRI